MFVLLCDTRITDDPSFQNSSFESKNKLFRVMKKLLRLIITASSMLGHSRFLSLNILSPILARFTRSCKVRHSLLLKENQQVCASASTTCFKESTWWDLNYRPLDFKACTLPLVWYYNCPLYLHVIRVLSYLKVTISARRAEDFFRNVLSGLDHRS